MGLYTLYMWIFYIIPAVLFFYSYAILSKNNEVNNKIALYLILTAVIAFAFEIIFEIKKDFNIFSLTPFACFLLIFFGSYMGYCVADYALHRKIQLSFRKFAWVPFLMNIIMAFISISIILIIGFGNTFQIDPVSFMIANLLMSFFGVIFYYIFWCWFHS